MGDLDKIGTAIDNAETPEEASLIAIVVETAIALLDAMDELHMHSICTGDIHGMSTLDTNIEEDVGGDDK